MFDRFLRFTEARNALKAGRFERVLQLCQDPLMRGHRETETIQSAALRGLLDRARRRAELGSLQDAMRDVDQVLGVSREFDGAASLRREIAARGDEAERKLAEARDLLQEARRAVEKGELGEAERLCHAAAPTSAAEAGVVRRLVERRRVDAREALRGVAAALQDGRPRDAREALFRARTLDRLLPVEADLLAKVVAACAASAAGEVDDQLARGGIGEAMAILARERAQLPEIGQGARFVHAEGRVAAALAARLRELVEAGDLERAVKEAGGLAEPWRTHPELHSAIEGLADLGRGLELRATGSFHAAAEALRAAGGMLRQPAVAALAEDAERAQKQCDQALAAARAHAAEGRLREARELLVPLLEAWPRHEVVKAELDQLSLGWMEREQRLVEARSMLREGRLREALRLAMPLAVPGTAGEEARLLLKEIQMHGDGVARGIDQIRRAMHGRDSASLDGVRHCLLRLDQLAKVQSDHPELSSLRAALEAEVRGLEVLEALRAGTESGRVQGLAGLAEEFVALRARLLTEDRLDARGLALADLMFARVRGLEAAGQVGAARGWLEVLGLLKVLHESVASRILTVQGGLEGREERARAVAARGLAAIEARDLPAAEAALDEARGTALDQAEVRKLEEAVRAARAREEQLRHVEALAGKMDFAGAQRRLAAMPPTEALFRTRIFDLKQNLARAQGLEGAFLLRVDEGGEYLVLRGDSITFGNLREALSDVPILANLAGRHARIVRSLSFHGGMQDKVVAERGEVRVGGVACTERVLQSGDRIRLGQTLELTYSMPSQRSLTAAIRIHGGFQVGGTDKLLLFKDRGRDGRILIGPAQDAHVRVPGSSTDVELYATKDGQVRVRHEGAGEMDGRPFQGEHPVTPGAWVRCGKVAFVLLPWTPR
ncbi:MAG: hypothetical protein IT458_10765 [Planctomycetes bacterium]|nr:hypothetical protein [Planctomycetota bacterium]